MTKAKLIDIVLRLVCLCLAIVAFLAWYKHQVEKRVVAECKLEQAQTIIVENKAQIKEVENVASQKAVIYSKPNASRDSLLNAMRQGKL